jgi:hypothetical protein
MAKLMWMMISFTLGIRGPANMFHFFDPCLEVFQKKTKESSVNRGGSFLLGFVAQ